MDVPDAITERTEQNGAPPEVQSPGRNSGSRLLESMRPHYCAGIFLERIRCVLGVLSVKEAESKFSAILKKIKIIVAKNACTDLSERWAR